MTSTRRQPSSSTAGNSGSDAPSRRVIYTGRWHTMFGPNGATTSRRGRAVGGTATGHSPAQRWLETSPASSSQGRGTNRGIEVSFYLLEAGGVRTESEVSRREYRSWRIIPARVGAFHRGLVRPHGSRRRRDGRLARPRPRDGAWPRARRRGRGDRQPQARRVRGAGARGAGGDRRR